jgi:hypothetical protein
MSFMPLNCNQKSFYYQQRQPDVPSYQDGQGQELESVDGRPGLKGLSMLD